MSTPQSVSHKKAQAILALGQKSFFLRPICLDHYLRQLDLTETAREVFWYHWGIGYRDRTVTTHLSISQVAAYLGISLSSVSRAYEQLSAAELILRRVQPAEHGGYGTAETTITIPDAVLTTLLADQPDRLVQKLNPVDTTPKMPPSVQTTSEPRSDTLDRAAPSMPSQDPHPTSPSSGHPGTEMSAKTIQTRIDDLDQALQHWNNEAIQCSKNKDVVGYRQAVTNAERSQQKRDQLRQHLTESESASAQAVESPAPRVAAPTSPPLTSAPSAPRQLHPTIQAEIARQVHAIPRVSNPPGVTQEVIFSIEQGAQKTRPVPWAIHSALALIRKNRWRTPHGFGGTPKLGAGVLSNPE
ncbi:MAG: hypothetical protein KDK04_02920 [Candidatus Competibacteraceae bacterium]|nr:hypothetical protein [Candidatus Competibacteraceae bacterium]